MGARRARRRATGRGPGSAPRRRRAPPRPTAPAPSRAPGSPPSAADDAKTAARSPAKTSTGCSRLAEPATADLRALAAYLTWAACQEPPPAALTPRLGPVSRFLEAHERLLPVRAVWLAWSHLRRLSGGDVLALARARDRLLERLYHNGLRPEQDLPSFLRFAGQPTSQRFRAVRQWMIDLGKLAQDVAKDERRPPPIATAADRRRTST